MTQVPPSNRTPHRGPPPDAARRELLRWFAEHQRPWPERRTRDPWRILVLEVASQQTQITRALELVERFCARFPTPRALADATPADALREWSGLGYNRRAISLWRAAVAIVEEHGGQVPRTVEALDALPGVGPYTARAVAVHAFGERVAPVDVNVRRVAARLAGSDDPVRVQVYADTLLDPAEPSRTVHALMDLAALVCRPRPRCGECPLAALCPSAGRVAGGARRAAEAPYRESKRWLRGALLRELVAAPPGEWRAIEGARGEHEPSRVREALASLATDGLIQLDEAGRARLAES